MAADFLASLVFHTAILSMALAGVLCLRRFVRRMSGAGVAYASWFAVPLALCATMLPQPEVLAVRESALEVRRIFADVTPAPPVVDASLGLVVFWLLGVAASLFVLYRQQARYMYRLGDLSRRPDGIWQAQSGNPGPALVGVLRPRIVVPHDFDDLYTQRERELILAHEDIHRRRGDALVNALIAGLRCLQWFNPLVYLAASHFRIDQELACDARVMRQFPNSRRSYADAMLKTQRIDPGLPVGCAWQSSHPIKERIAMLQKSVPGGVMRAIGISTIFATALATACIAWAAEASQVSASYASLSPPQYPDDVSGITPEGTVYLKVHVGIDGRPVSVDRAKVLPDTLREAIADRLAESAIAAVRTWAFEPAERDGAKQESSVIVPVRFTAVPQSSSPDWTPPGSDVVLDEILTQKQ